jgi:RNA polymerase sigma-70 factor (ECF subfamily)
MAACRIQRSSRLRKAPAEQFATTRWSIVVAAGRRSSPDVRAALATLCATYWYPLYAYVRRQGHAAEDAQDLTQEFFARLLEKNYVAAADRSRGKFRSFLLASLKHFLANEWRRGAAQKRGGRSTPLPLDLAAGEHRYSLEPSHELTPERIFERRWAMALLEQTLAKLRDEYSRGDKLMLFDRLKAYLGGDRGNVPYRQLAEEMTLSEGAVKVAVHRMRRRCRELLRAEIAQTVTGPEEVNEELCDLFKAVGGSRMKPARVDPQRAV